MPTYRPPKLLFVPLSCQARTALREKADHERRRMQDEAAILLETALGLREPPPAVPRGATVAPAEPVDEERAAYAAASPPGEAA